MDQRSEHVSRELMQRFFRSNLSRRDTQMVVRHLMHRCDACLETAIEVAAGEGYSFKKEDFRDLFREDKEGRGAVLLRRLGSIDEERAELARERLRGIGLWHTLEKQEQGRRLAMIREDPRMQTWGLYDRLLEKCREMGFHAPSYAAGIAELALAVVETLDPLRHGADTIADLRAQALGALGNARRLASDFAGAASAFQQARDGLRLGTGDPLQEARLVSVEASLLKDLGEFERAFAALECAVATYRELDQPHLVGRTLLKQAEIIGYVQPDKAVRLAQEGLTLIDSLREPRLEMCGRHSLALFLNDSGKPDEALAILEASRPLYAQFEEPWTRVRLHALEGKIARSLGDLAEAEETFKRLWYDLQEPAYAHELTLLSLDLAEVYVAQGKHEEALELVEEFGPLLQEWGMHAEGLAMWLLLERSVRERRAGTTLFRHMTEYLARAWHRPLHGTDG